MKIPVFVSCPTALNPQQDASRKLILSELARHGLEPRALGRSDYPTELPLREVLLLAKHCAGGIILGFEQFEANGGTWKRGTTNPRVVPGPTPFPTAGITSKREFSLVWGYRCSSFARMAWRGESLTTA
ncbi:MAG TPA: hypothetical protein VLK84_02395 [Longimicrobium sp.]|nr:hypothetical protein [Longimicrobium sp.]